MGAAQEHSPRQRGLLLALLAPVFLLLLPGLFVRLGTQLDAWLQWPAVPSPPLSLIVGCLLVVPSGSLAYWSMDGLFTTGRGTPLPLIPTQRLVVDRPYSCCRNPMALAAIGLYLGIAVAFGSLGAVVLVLLAACALLVYIRRVEEPELLRRFGNPYAVYRAATPFLLPRCRRRG